jgi:hypothetical protein
LQFYIKNHSAAFFSLRQIYIFRKIHIPLRPRLEKFCPKLEHCGFRWNKLQAATIKENGSNRFNCRAINVAAEGAAKENKSK